MLGFISR